jgi:hypothetical protein
MEEPPVRPFHLALSLSAALLVPVLARAESVPVPAVMGAAPKSGIIGIDAMTGTVFQQGQSSFSGMALRLRVRHPRLVPNVEILPTFEYWQNTSHVDAFDIETKRRDAALTADVRWMFRSRPWQPYLGTGFGLHFLDSEVRAPSLGLPHGSEGLVKGGLDVLGGIQSNPEARLGSFLELKFINVTSYRQFKFNTGLLWNF